MYTFLFRDIYAIIINHIGPDSGYTNIQDKHILKCLCSPLLCGTFKAQVAPLTSTELHMPNPKPIQVYGKNLHQLERAFAQVLCLVASVCRIRPIIIRGLSTDLHYLGDRLSNKDHDVGHFSGSDVNGRS